MNKFGISVVIVTVFALIMVLMFSLSGASCGSNHSLKFVGAESEGSRVMQHWKDSNSGECYYSYSNGKLGTLIIWPERCQ